MTRFRLLDAGPLTAAQNMALDEILTSRAGQGQSPPTLRFLRFSPEAALLGYHQQAERELRLAFCREHGIDVNRRLTGGGALLFQSSALGWELVGSQGTGPFSGGFAKSLERICLSAAKGFSRLGVNASFRPRNDIEVDGRKICGTGGFSLDGGVLFQGTALVKNEIERFLRALRVPVEKLKKHEIDSLMERLAFLEDLLGRELDLQELKDHLAAQFASDLDMELVPGGLTDEEREALVERLPYFESDQWVGLRSSPSGAPSWLRHIAQTDEGTLSVNLWLDRRGKRIQKALITGDFFSQPQRLVFDLEAALMGQKAEPDIVRAKVLELLQASGGELLGIENQVVARAVARAVQRRSLSPFFSPGQAAELFFVNLSPKEAMAAKAQWLLLPYCSKPVDCDLRKIADCDRCGLCDFDRFYSLAEELGMTPLSIQSFEHLMVELKMIHGRGEIFAGSCCEAFYCKHQKEMEDCGARGVLINLDSTTCYDLGKGMEAYVGNFDHQTFMNVELIEKVSRTMSPLKDSQPDGGTHGS